MRCAPLVSVISQLIDPDGPTLAAMTYPAECRVDRTARIRRELASAVPADRAALTSDRLGDLPEATRHLVEEELASREFVPEIRRLRHVSTFALPSTWDVETDRGEARLILKSEEDIRRLGPATLLIGDSHGVQYLIRDLASLDKTSRRLLDRFM